jgi:hypothetical protein
LVAWFDGVKTGYARIDDWTNMRAAVKDNDWGRVHHYMELYKDRPLTHAYALFAFAKMEMQVERDGGMSMHCADAFAHAKVHSTSMYLPTDTTTATMTTTCLALTLPLILTAPPLIACTVHYAHTYRC